MRFNQSTLLGIIGLAERIYGSPIAIDLLRWFQTRLGPDYSDEQLATLDKHYVEGLERQADATRRADG